MPNRFLVKEISPSGVTIENFLEADTKDEVFEIVKSRGGIPIKVEDQGEVKSKNINFNIEIIKKRVTVKDLAIFCKQANTMLAAGMNLIRTLEVLAIQTQNDRFKEVINDVSSEIQKGYQLSVALKMHTDVFPPLFISMIESGEMTGNLDAILDALSTHYTKENRMNTKVRSATIYPAILLAVSIAVVTLMLVYVVPQITNMFVSSGTSLPVITQLLINISDFLIKYWIQLLLTAIATPIIIKFYLKSDDHKLQFNRLVDWIPQVGDAVAKVATARFARTMSTLLQSGIPILAALKAAASVTRNMIIIRGIEEISEEVKKGQSLSVMLSTIGYFPNMMVAMIAIGEESGDLEGLLEKTAGYYDEEMEDALQALVSMMEPAMILVMGGLIAFIVIGMFLPIFDLPSTMQ